MPYDNTTPRYNSNPQYNGRRTGGAQRNNNSDSVTTNGVFLHNDKVGRFLRIRFWSRTMSMDIGTYPPGATLDLNVTQNAQTFNQNITFSTIFELKEICEEVLESLKNVGRFTPVGTMATQKNDSIVEISDGSNINMSPGIYLVLYKNVDVGKRSNTYEYYQFGSSKVLRNYDHNTGSMTEDIRATGDFKKFIKCLDEAAAAFTMAQAHAVAEVNKSEKTSTFMALSALAAGLGVDMSKAVTASQSGSGRFNNDQQKSQNFQRRSQPGQWNRSNNQYNGRSNSYQQNNGYQRANPHQQAMAAVTDEPVDINIDAATLQNVSMDQFN